MMAYYGGILTTVRVSSNQASGRIWRASDEIIYLGDITYVVQDEVTEQAASSFRTPAQV
jgi:hypothetical protein